MGGTEDFLDFLGLVFISMASSLMKSLKKYLLQFLLSWYRRNQSPSWHLLSRYRRHRSPLLSYLCRIWKLSTFYYSIVFTDHLFIEQPKSDGVKEEYAERGEEADGGPHDQELVPEPQQEVDLLVNDVLHTTM